MAYLPAPGDNETFAGGADQNVPFYRRYLGVFAVAIIVVVFLAAPFSFEDKAHAVLHGICGQTPGHTLQFEGMSLPLDSRCVGIFAGLLSTFLILLGLGRSRAAGLPTLGAGIILLIFLGAMALDGLNSLMFDLGRWHPYTPTNDLRLLTGWMAGVGLGTLLLMVTGMSLWRRPKTSMRAIPSWWWPFALMAPLLPFWALLRTGSSLIFYPTSMALMGAALTAFSALAVCSIVMLRNRDNTYTSVAQLSSTLCLGIVIAAGILLLMSGGRFWLERAFGLGAPA